MSAERSNGHEKDRGVEEPGEKHCIVGPHQGAAGGESNYIQKDQQGVDLLAGIEFTRWWGLDMRVIGRPEGRDHPGDVGQTQAELLTKIRQVPLSSDEKKRKDEAQYPQRAGDLMNSAHGCDERRRKHDETGNDFQRAGDEQYEKGNGIGPMKYDFRPLEPSDHLFFFGGL